MSNDNKINVINENFHKINVVDEYLHYLESVSSEIIKYYEDENKDTGDSDEDYLVLSKKVFEFYQTKLPEINNKTKQYQSREITDFNKSGITCGKLNKETQTELLKLVNKFASSTVVDYHPGSENRVRDLVHPSVYPLVKGKKSKPKKFDFWKRPYESSKYQWLPSEFKINSEGKCTISSYINNLPIGENPMYKTIEKLFEQVLPELEKAWSYANSIKIFQDEEDIEGYTTRNLIPHSLKNKNLQVITKIVQVTLGPHDSLLGSWHVEGMSHENIVATASCTLEQPDGFDAKLYFKRTYYEEEAGYLVMGTPQYPPEPVYNLFNKNLVPIGKSTIKEGSLVVFPNNFVHKIDMINNTDQPKTRTILVFWLVNPNVRIKSTKDIAPQTYDWEDAKKVRLELMKERTFYKQTFNQREINLCEH